MEQPSEMCLDWRVAPRRLPLNAEWWRNHFGRTRRRTRSIPLFVAVTSAVIIGAALIWLGYAVFEHVVGTDNTKSTSRGQTVFSGTITDFQRATFSGSVYFNHALFSCDYAWFKNAKFIGDNTWGRFQRRRVQQ